MSTFLPDDVRKGLETARKRDMKRKNRLRVGTGPEALPIIHFRETEFTLDREDAPHLRGLVDIFDGSRHLYQALIVTAAEDGDQMVYEFKRMTQARDLAPVDYQIDETAPVALLPRN